MFDIYKKKITINGYEYELKPLSGKYLPKMYVLFNKLDLSDNPNASEGDKAKSFLKSMSESDMATIHDICFECFKRSYPEQNPEQLDEFVSQNLMHVFPAVVEVNMQNRPGKE